MGYKLNQSGFLSGAPYLAMGTLLIFSGYIADMFQIKGYLTTTQVIFYNIFQLTTIKIKTNSQRYDATLIVEDF